MKHTILCTGGLGYVGSHTVIELITKGYNVIIVDNLSNSNIVVLDKIEIITKHRPIFYCTDLLDFNDYEKIFLENEIEAVIHFAAFKSVSESLENPLMYYQNNIQSTLNTLRLMRMYNVNTLIFSSSAIVYDSSFSAPYKETSNIGNASNPYGWSKIMIETILNDIASSNKNLSIISLRYFNPIGAHESGLIGEDPKGTPNNLFPFLNKVASGKFKELLIYGNDFDTLDGTGVRDYIHVVDLAKGHVNALEYSHDFKGYDVFNLGTGKGISVLNVVKEYMKANNLIIPYRIVNRRKGDISVSFADVDKSSKILNWKAEKNIQDMCKDSWKWERGKKE